MVALTVGIRIQRPDSRQIGKVGDYAPATDTLGVLEEEQVSAMVAVEDLHRRADTGLGLLLIIRSTI